ncbi:hypothetical protein PNEG_00894 [Pneumocystis murina B123]|uniref:Uncharacterized protein n=1 Tax=Pneumocystis murina (strain B123) TaxID=1069680 RepID=M7PA73_PNEMU|nr:hypothetical protein PNEG_00894 [Pneumocystis murina B123]EMR10745.1 hypothetical protein PNEG_00894 [Pneumocystis murina B123]
MIEEKFINDIDIEKSGTDKNIDGNIDGNINGDTESVKAIYIKENFTQKRQKSCLSTCTIQRRSGKIWNHDNEQRNLLGRSSSDIGVKYRSNTFTTLSASSDTDSLLTIEMQETLESEKILDSSDKLSEGSDNLLNEAPDSSNSLVSDSSNSLVSESLNTLKRSKRYRHQPIRHIFKEKVYKEFPWESLQEKDNLLSKEEFHKNENFMKNNFEKKKAIKFKSVLSIIEEISKSTSELLNTGLQYVEMPNSLYESSITESEKSIDIPFPSPTITLQQGENIYGNEEIEEQPNRTSLFRRSIFGGYIPENNFQSIKLALKEIVQDNKKLREKKGLSDKHMQYSSVENGSTNNLINSNISVLAQNDLKSNKLSKVNKEHQNNHTFMNRFSESRLSLQETSNLNNSFEFLLENYKNYKLTTIKGSPDSTFALNIQKDVDGKSISKEKNIKNISFEAKRIANNENIRPNDDSLFNLKNSNKISRNYNYNDSSILDFNQVNKQTNPEDFSSIDSCNNTYPIHTEQFNENEGSDLNSDKLSSWLLSVKNKYQNIDLEKICDICNSTDLDSKHSSQMENNQIINIFSFSKLGNKSSFIVKKTFNSFKKK